VIDEYYLALLALENEIEQFEDRAVETSDSSFTMEIQGTKKLLLKIKRAMLPLRDILGAASRGEEPLLDGELKPFLQDLRENLNNARDTVESSREWLVNIMDVKLSVLSHQMNKVMKTLAVISTIFIPLTFIAGVYGMNFENMPELSTRWGYPIVLGGMAVIALIMLLLFKRRRWF
jgi:magnesium transporter